MEFLILFQLQELYQEKEEAEKLRKECLIKLERIEKENSKNF